jgi:hypothetical protein
MVLLESAQALDGGWMTISSQILAALVDLILFKWF